MVQKKIKKHNGNISIWKFIFALLILLHHCNYINGSYAWKFFHQGSIGVEFFFLVSGYLLAAKVYSESRKRAKKEIYASTLEFIKNKIKSFYPYLLFSYISFIIISFIFYRYSGYRYLYSLLDLLLLEQTGIPIGNFMIVNWYLSAMVIAMAIIYPIMTKYKEKFSCLYGPLLALIGFGILLHVAPSIRSYMHWNGFIYNGLARALIEITLGTTLYEITKKFDKVKLTKLGSILLSIGQLLLFGFVIVMNSIYINSHYFDWLFLPIIFFGIVIGFSEKTCLSNWCNNKVFYYLEKLSLPLYLNNFLFVRMFNNSMFNDISQLKKWIFAVSLTIIYSMLELFLVERIKPLFSKLWLKGKSLIIST